MAELPMGCGEEARIVRPTARRVAERGMVLAAVSARARLGQELSEEEKRDVRRFLGWVHRLGLADEMEQSERDYISAPVGEPDLQMNINGSWRIEGAAVLAWALGLADLPDYDELAVPRKVCEAFGWTEDGAGKVLVDAKLRSVEELARFNFQILTLHWRLHDYQISPKPLDYGALSRKTDYFFSTFDYGYVRMAEGDLEIDGVPIAAADGNSLQRVSSCTRERHIASNWLMGWHEIYSAVSTDT
jgi:hypothetical protein